MQRGGLVSLADEGKTTTTNNADGSTTATTTYSDGSKKTVTTSKDGAYINTYNFNNKWVRESANKTFIDKARGYTVYELYGKDNKTVLES